MTFNQSKFQSFLKYLITILIVIIFITCSKDNPTEPDDKSPVNSDFTFITSQNVGPAGGEIIADELIIDIPTGCFDSEFEIVVSTSNKDVPLEGEQNSMTYLIEGIPSAYKKDIYLLFEKSSSNNDLIAIGEESTVHGKQHTGYRFLETSDSNIYTMARIPHVPNNNEFLLSKYNSTQRGKLIISRQSVFSKYLSSGGHFEVSFLINVGNDGAIKLGEYLEEAYDKLINLGFSYSARFLWPVKITLRKMATGTDGLTSNSYFGNSFGYIEYNTDLLSDYSKLRITAAHEFFHLVQFLYDSRGSYDKVKYPSNFHWINESTAAWFEEKFSSNSSYYPEVVNGNEEYLFDGVQLDPYGADGNIVENFMYKCYGRAPIIKYIVNEYGENSIIKIYDLLKKSKHPIETLNEVLPSTWWSMFFKKLIPSKVYKDIGLKNWAQLTSNRSFKISSITDKEKSFVSNYQDLSGEIFQVKLLHDQFTNKNIATFNLEGSVNSMLTLFKYDKNGIEFFSENTNRIIIENLKSYRDNESHFFAVVSNNDFSPPYTNSQDLTLKINIEEESTPSLDFTKSSFTLDFDPIIKRTDANGSTEQPLAGTWSFYIYNTIGSFTGNTYNGSFNERSGEFIGSITATLDESLSKITNFTYKFEYTPSANYKSIYQVSGSNIPVTLKDDDEIRCGIYFDKSIYNNLTNVSYKSEYTYNGSPVIEELIDYSCDDYSVISISFKK